MSQEDYAASIFFTSILGSVLVPVLYCFCKNLKSQSKFSLFLSSLFLLILFLVFTYSLSSLFGADQPKQPFDPYEILSVPPTATDKEIKSAFRELSRKYHPDKSDTDNDRYLQITKAYETLTNPTAKENFQKYGNPDGPSGYKVKNYLDQLWTADFLVQTGKSNPDFTWIFTCNGMCAVWDRVLDARRQRFR